MHNRRSLLETIIMACLMHIAAIGEWSYWRADKTLATYS